MKKSEAHTRAGRAPSWLSSVTGKSFRRSQANQQRQRARRRFLRPVERLEERTLLATFAVTNFDDTLDPDDGVLSLREAVREANLNPGPDTIELPAGTFSLSLAGREENSAATGDLDINGDTSLRGAGAEATVIDAGGIDRVLHILPDGILSISGVTVTGGDAQDGGGILNEGELRISDSTIFANTAAEGGAIYNEADLTINESVLSENTAASRGGALFTNQSALLSGVTIESNTAEQGAVYFNESSTDLAQPAGGQVELVNPTLRNNQASGSAQNIAAGFTELLNDHADDLIDGTDQFYGLISDRLDQVIRSVDVPFIGDRIVDVFQPVVDELEAVRIDTREFLDSVFDDDLPDLFGAVQQAFFKALGPAGLNVLLDGPDSGADVNPTDIALTLGEDGRGNRWTQFNVHLRQRLIADIPGFELGLGQLAGFVPDPGVASELEELFSIFAFDVGASNGIRSDLRWDLRLGLGVSDIVGQEFYLQAGTTTTGRVDGPPVEEFRASVDIFTAPSSDAIGLGQVFSETPGLSATATIGLSQAEIADGTPAAISITAPKGLPGGFLAPFDFSNEFTITIDDQPPRTINYPVPFDNVPTFLAGVNAAIVAEFQTPLPPVAFTLDFTRINRFFNAEDAPTTPSLVLRARDPDISFLKIEGAEEWGFASEQVEDRRARGLGFGNNATSQLAADGSGNQVFLAEREAPGEGRLIDDVSFILNVGGERVANPNATSEADEFITTGGAAIFVDIAEIFHRDIVSQEELREVVEDFVQQAVESQTSFRGEQITLDLEGGRFRLTAAQGADGSPAPLLTITYAVVDQTRLQVIGGFDITAPSFDAATAAINPRDQRFFNRTRLLDFAEPTAVFVPVLKADADARFHVETGADHIIGFAEQYLGLSPNSIGLPSVSYDFILDAGVDFGELLRQAGQGGQDPDDGMEMDGEGAMPSIFDNLEIDTLQFANITLDLEEFLQTVVVPTVQAAAETLEPAFEFFGETADDPNALVNFRLPVISDIVGENITLASFFPEDLLDGFFDAVSTLSNVGDAATEFLQSPEFVSRTDGQGRFVFGGLELIMDPDSPLFFPRTRIPVPADLTSYLNIGDAVGLNDFLNTFLTANVLPDIIQLDVLRPMEIFNFILGEPATLVSFGLPTVDIDAGIDFGFNFGEVGFNIDGLAQLDSQLRFAYDTLGIERIVGSLLEGTTPDPADLLDGFHIQNNPNGFELGAVVDFDANGMVDTPFFVGDFLLDLHGDLGLELFDPNGDGALRLDEIFDITNDFENPEHLACLFDVTGSGFANVSAGAVIPGTPDIDLGPLGTIPGIPDINLGMADLGLVGGEFSLLDIIQRDGTLEFCDALHDSSPILAEVVEQDGQQVLRINTGPFAHARLYGDTSDVAEETVPPATEGLTVVVRRLGEDIEVTINDPDSDELTNLSQSIPAAGIARVVATGTARDDTYDFSGLAIPVEFNGGTGDDSVTGGSAGDKLDGGPGNDLLTGAAGDDELVGGTGNDILLGGAGADTLNGGGGDDDLQGGSGNDNLDGGRGDDSAAGGDGNDSVDGGAGNDSLVGGAGADTISAGSGDDTVSGGSGNDVLDGGRGDDVIAGGSGNDILEGGQGHDVVDGNAGNDRIDSRSGNNILRGGPGNDVVVGGVDDDDIDGNDGDDTLLGGMGDDEISGGGGRDVLDGGTGDDVLGAGAGDFEVRGGDDDDTLVFGTANSSSRLQVLLADRAVTTTDEASSTLVTSYSGIEQRRVFLGDGNDELTVLGSFAGPTTIFTGGGRDDLTIRYSGGELDVRAGMAGQDTVAVEEIAAATVIATAGADLDVTAANSSDRVNTIAGPLLVNGARSANSRLAVRDAGATENLDVTLPGNTVAGLDLQGAITYANLSQFELFLGVGDDTATVNVATAAAENVTVNTGPGQDNVTVNALAIGSNNLTLEGQTGNDTFQIPNLESLEGRITVDGGEGADYLAATLLGTPSLQADSPGIMTSAVEDILVANNNNSQPTEWAIDGNGLVVERRVTADQRAVLSSSGANRTELRLGFGADTVNILAIDHATTVDGRGGSDEVTVGAVNNLSRIAAPLHISGAGGNDELTLDDTGPVVVGEVRSGTIDTGQVTGFGLADSITYEGFANLTVNLGGARNQVTVAGTSTPTRLNTGADDDTVLVHDVSAPLNIELEQGTDALTVFNSRERISVDAGIDGANITLDRSNEVVGFTGSVTSPDANTTRIRGLGFGDVDLVNPDGASTSTVNVQLGAGSDELEINTTSPHPLIDVRGNDGDDRLQVRSLGGQVVFSGESDNDSIEVLIPGNPAASRFGRLGSAERLIVSNVVDGIPFEGDVVWTHTNNDGLSANGQTGLLVETSGFDRVQILGGSGTNTLHVATDSATNVRATIAGPTVELVDGVEVLEFIGHEGSFEEPAALDGLEGATQIAATSSGEFLYAVSTGDDAIVVFRRPPGNAPLQYVQTLRHPGLLNPTSIVLSPDDASVYVGGAGSSSQIHTYDRAPTGQLQLVGSLQVTAAADNVELAISPDAGNVYAVANGQITAFARDSSTGQLSAGPPVQSVAGLDEAVSVVVSEDDEYVYVLSEGQLTKFRRNTTSGELTHLFSRTGAGLQINASIESAISDDGEFAYLFDTAGNIQAFSRDVESGQLLHREQLVSTGGGTPRSIVTRDDTVYALTGDADSTLSVFELDSTTRTLVPAASFDFSGFAGEELTVSADHLEIRIGGTSGGTGELLRLVRNTTAASFTPGAEVPGLGNDVRAVANHRDSGDTYVATHSFDAQPAGEAANYRNDFQTSVPPFGWQYLTNHLSSFGNPANYVPLAWNAVRNRYEIPFDDGSGVSVNDIGYLDANGGMAGFREDEPFEVDLSSDQFIIAAYDVGQPGIYQLDLDVAADSGLEILIHDRSGNTRFDERGGVRRETLSGNETIYVAVGPGSAAPGSRSFTFDEFRIVREASISNERHGIQVLRGTALVDQVSLDAIPQAIVDLATSPPASVLDTDYIVASQGRTLTNYSRRSDGTLVFEDRTSTDDATVVEFSSDGRFVYAGLGSGNTALAVYEISSNGRLILAQSIPRTTFDGVNPTHLEAHDGLLYAGADSGDEIRVFSQDASGLLSPTPITITTGSNSITVNDAADLLVLQGGDESSAEDHLYIAAGNALQFVTSRHDRSDLVTTAPLTGQAIHSLAAGPDAEFVYSTDTDSNLIRVFDRNNRGELASRATARLDDVDGVALSGVEGLVVNAGADDRSLVYAVDPQAAGLIALEHDSSSGAFTVERVLLENAQLDVAVTGLQSIVATANADLLFAVSPSDSALVVLDSSLQQRQVLFNWLDGISGLGRAEAVAVSEDGANLYVAAREEDGVTVFDVDDSNLASPVSAARTRRTSTSLSAPRSIAVSPDDAHVYVGGEQGLTRFVRDPSSGDLSAPHAAQLANFPLAAEPTNVAALQVSPDGRYVFAADDVEGRLSIFARNSNNGRLSDDQTVEDSSDYPLAGARGLAVSPDGNFVYVAASGADAITVFGRDHDSGDYTPRNAVFDGTFGVRGLAGVSSLSLTEGAGGRFLIASGPNNNALVVFQVDTATGELTYRHTLRNNVADVRGLQRPSGIAVSDSSVYVSTLDGLGTENGGVAKFNNLAFDAPLVEPTRQVTEFSNIAHLEVATNTGHDFLTLVSQPPVTTTTLRSGLGADHVNLLALSGQTTVNAGADDDQINVRSSTPQAELTLRAGSGNDRVELQHAGEGSTISVHGGDGDDEVFVAGANLPETAAATITGNDHVEGDRLFFDPGGRLVPTGNPGATAGTIQAQDRGAVAYNTIEHDPVVIAAPVADAGGSYTVREGQPSLTFDASATDELLDPAVTYEWDLTGDGQFENASGRMVSLTFEQLLSLGLGDGSVGGTFHQVAVRATNSLGFSAVALAPLTVFNEAPGILSAAPQGPALEGSPTMLGVVAVDPAGANDPLTYAFDFDNDGQFDRVTASATVEHIFPDDGEFTVSLRVTDGDGGSVEGTIAVAVENVAPAVAIIGADSASESGLYELALRAGADPGDDSISAWTVNWGDGAVDQINGNPATVTHVYADDGDYTVSAAAIDEDGTYAASNNVTVRVENVAPTILLAAPQGAALEGSPTTLSVLAVDPAGASDPLTYSFDFDNDGEFDLTTADGIVQHTFLDDGDFVVSVRVTDGDGGSVDGTIALEVQNVAPAVGISGTSFASEGSAYVLDLSAGADPGSDSISSWTVNWGDGTIGQISGNPATATHIYLDDGDYTISASAMDEDGAYLADNAVAVQVGNVAPTLTISGNTEVAEGTYALGLSATDPGDDSITGWTINWGDGSPNQHVAGNPASVLHEFDGPGLYTVTAAAMDEDGEYTAASLTVQVNNALPVLGDITVVTQDPIEGSPVLLRVAASDPAGRNDVLSYRFDFDADGLFDAGSQTGEIQHTFDDDGTFLVAVQVVDDDGAAASGTIEVVVENVEPTLALQAPGAVDEGAEFQIDLSVLDPGDDTVIGYQVDWGDGSVETYSLNDSQGPAPSHIYTDGDAPISETFAQLATVDVSVDSELTLDLSALNPAADIVFWIVDWGDGSESQTFSAEATTATHTYTHSGDFNIVATSTRLSRRTIVVSSLQDEDGTHSTFQSVDLSVVNVAPDIGLAGAPIHPVVNDYQLTLGQTIDPGDDTIGAFTILWGDGTSDEFARPPVPGEVISHRYSAAGEATIQVFLEDEDGRSAAATQLALEVVANMAPTADAGGPYSVDEGSTVQLDAGMTTDIEQSTEALLFEWDLDGDNVYGETGLAAERGDEVGIAPTFSAAGLDGFAGNSVDVGLRVTDDHGDTDGDTATIRVANVAPKPVSDVVEVSEDGPAVTIHVLNNDSDPAGALDPLTITVVSGGTVGTLVATDGVTVTYDPSGRFESLDSGDAVTETLAYTVADGDGGAATASVAVTVLGANDAPVAVSDVASTSEDVPLAADVLANDTDVDGDDEPSNFSLDSIDGIVVHGLTIDPAQVATLATIVGNDIRFAPGTGFNELSGEESATVIIGYTMSDDEGASSSSELTLTVHGANEDPVIADLSSDHAEACGGSADGLVAIHGTFSDMDVSDTQTITVDWGDGSTIEPLSFGRLSNAFAGSHHYDAGGIYTITVTIDDGNGGTATATTTAVVQGVGVVDGTLYIVGTDGRDHVDLKFNERRDIVTVRAKLKDGRNGYSADGAGWRGEGSLRIKETLDLSSIDKIVAHLCGGNDRYNGGGGWFDLGFGGWSDGGSDGGSDGAGDVAAVSQFVFGGAGNDHIQGGRGDDVLSGGRGNDRLAGRSGNDILVGGDGRDKLSGSGGRDLLIGGSASREDDLASLEAALADWTDGDLVGALVELGTIVDDCDRDSLSGGRGLDHLLGGIGDKLRR